MPNARPIVPISEPLLVGDWLVDPALDEISQGSTVVKLEPRTMRLLLALAHRPGEVVTGDELLATVWKDAIVTSSSVYEGVAQLRKALGDRGDGARYILTVPRKGYRLVANVSPRPERRAEASADPATELRSARPPAAVGATFSTARPTFIERLPVWGPAGLGLLVGLSILAEDLTRPASNASTPSVETAPRSDQRRAERIPRVLWVDDKPDNNVREREALAAFNVQFDLALSTEEALQRLAASRYDLIISDMNRPGDPRAGYALLQALRARGDATRFILYTSSCSESEMQDARTRGALGCSAQISKLMQLAIAALEAAR